jgi:hypothetical protein
MKKAGAYRVLGLYRGGDSAWQAARVASDGVVLEDIQPFPELDRLEQVADLATNVGAIAVETTVDAEASDLAVLRRATSLPILHSFRDNDRGMGGHGRPLEPFYLHALARHLEMPGPVLFVDLGRVARLCWADPAITDPAQAVLAFEAGPALGGLERLLNQRGISAPKGGQVVDGALELFLDDPFFRRMPPKWVQPDSFALMLDLVMELGDADAYATLCGGRHGGDAGAGAFATPASDRGSDRAGAHPFAACADAAGGAGCARA